MRIQGTEASMAIPSISGQKQRQTEKVDSVSSQFDSVTLQSDYAYPFPIYNAKGQLLGEAESAAWKSVRAKYGNSMTFNEFCDFTYELANVGLLTEDEASKATSDAMFGMIIKKTREENSVGHDLSYSISDQTVDFSELITLLMDENREYSDVNEGKSQREFLQKYYTFLSGEFPPTKVGDEG